MPRRYHRVAGDPFARLNVHLWDLPRGEGPQLLITSSHVSWPRLGPGMGVLVGGEGGLPGALAYGLGEDMALVWGIRRPGMAFTGYLHHAPSHPSLPPLHWTALTRLGVGAQDLQFLYVLAASRRNILDTELEPFLAMGIPDNRLHIYTGALIPQIGVTAEGWVGEIG